MRKKKVRLIFLDHCTCIGGAQISLQELIGALNAKNISTVFLSPNRPHKIFPLVIRAKKFLAVKYSVNMVWILCVWIAHGFPRIYCNSLRDRIICTLIPPLFLITHIRDFPKPIHIKCLQFLPSQKIVVSSKFMYNSIINMGIKQNVYLIPNIISFSQTIIKPKKSQIVNMLMVANFVPWKNHLLVLQAIKELVHSGEKISLEIWGADPLQENDQYVQKIRCMVNDGLQKNVKLIENKKITAEEYGKFDFLIHAAVNEPFGRVIIEALGNGLPALVHNSGEPPNLVKKYSGGVIFDTHNPKRLADEILMMSQNYEQIKTTLAKNLLKIRLDYSAETALKALTEAKII